MRPINSKIRSFWHYYSQHNAQWQDEVPFLSDAEKSAIQTYFSEKNVAISAEDYQRLFIGPDALPVPLGDRFI